MADTKIISIGYQIPGFSNRFHDYLSDQSLLDADVVVFQPQTFGTSYGGGKAEFTESYSFRIEQSAGHWRRELLTALEYGKTVFLFLGKYEVASIPTGRKEFKGRTTINYVRDFSNYEFLPVQLSLTAKTGTEIVFTGDPVFAPLWKDFKKHFKFDCYLNEKVKRPIFSTKTGERPTGAVVNIKKGHLVLLPLLEYDHDKFLKKHRDGEHYWTKEALAFGNKLVTNLIAIDKAIRSESMRTPPPSWLSDPALISRRETEILSAITHKKDEIAKLANEELDLQSRLKDEQQLKDLLFETGKPLEQVVISALKSLGYSAEGYNDGTLELDQVIVSPEGQRFVGECEGKDNAAVNIDKFRQLAENIETDFRREEIDRPAIGILFGNGFRLTNPTDRQEQFTQKCLSSAKRGTVLVRTMDLYPVVRHVQETNDNGYAKACRDAIAASVGRIVEFPAPPKT